MRGFAVVVVMMGVLVACGDSSSDGGAPTTPTPVTVPETTPAATPPPTVADTPISAPVPTDAPVTTPATAAPASFEPPSSGGGLGETIGVSDSVTITVSDPED